MKIISTKVHGVLDYLYGLALIAAPWIFNFNYDGPSAYVCDFLGVTTIVVATFTKYELSFSKDIPMRTHLAIDVIMGILLIASPWMFGFAHEVYLPHVVFGVIAIVVALISSPTPQYNAHPKPTFGAKRNL